MDISAKSVAKALIFAWLSRFRVPFRIITVRLLQFEASLFHKPSRLLRVQHLRTISYHPATNGSIANWKPLSMLLLIRTVSLIFSPIVLLGCRSAVKEDLGNSSTRLLYGTPLALPGQMLAPVNLPNADPVSYNRQLRSFFAYLSCNQIFPLGLMCL